jgi:hypothetical protein
MLNGVDPYEWLRSLRRWSQDIRRTGLMSCCRGHHVLGNRSADERGLLRRKAHRLFLIEMRGTRARHEVQAVLIVCSMKKPGLRGRGTLRAVEAAPFAYGFTFGDSRGTNFC